MALSLMPIEDPVFDPIVIPEPPPDFPMPETPALITAYAMVIQDFIDNKIADFDSYYTPMQILRQELLLAKDGVFRKYHKARRELLEAVGKRNLTSMPGYVMRQLGELQVEEKREVADLQLKIMSEKTATSLSNVEWAVKAGLDSVTQRNSTVQGISELNLEILNDALKAGLAVVQQRVQRANALIKEAGLLIEQETVQQRINNLATIRLIADQKVQKVNLDILLYEIEAQAVGAELPVLAAKLVAAENEVLVLQAQIEKALVETQVALAQEALAALKVITAQYERQKSDARMAAALLEGAKVDTQIAKVQAEESKVAAQKAAELAAVALSAAEKRLELMRDQMEIARTKASADITSIRAQIESDEASNLAIRTGNVNSFIGTRASNTQSTMDQMGQLIDQAAQNIADEIGQTNGIAGAISGYADEAAGQSSSLATQHAGNVTGYIGDIQGEAATASGNAGAQVASINGVASLYEGNIQTLVGNMDAEAGQAVINIDSRVIGLKQETTAARQLIDGTVTSNEIIAGLLFSEMGLRINNLLTAAETAKQNLINETSGRFSQYQHDAEVKKTDLATSLEGSYGDWESKVKEIASDKAAAITQAASNAANAKLTSKHTYLKG